MFSLAGKTALITGASGGIGGSIAKSLHTQGAVVGLCGRKKEALASLAAELGDRYFIFEGDLNSAEAADDLIKEAEEKMGKVDILVNNAGLTKDNLFMRMKDYEWQEVQDVNLTTPFRLTRAVIRGMMKRRNGRVINIASVVGVTGNPGQANYCSTKAGIIGMSKAMAAEVASRNITINCVAPGFIATPMTEKLNDEQKAAINSKIPAGVMGTPDDVANAVLFLASDEAKYITGQTIHVNGGMAMI